MLRKIRESLHRQKQGLNVLALLLEEEFSELLDGQPKNVSQIELSVQELMRQLMSEKMALGRLIELIRPGKPRLTEALATMPPATAAPIRQMLEDIDKAEQRCAKQAEKNYQLALGLFDQSKSLLEYIRKEVSPPNQNAYSARGRYAQGGPSKASLIHGRL